MATTTTRVIAYTRVSSDEQATSGISLAAQESKLRAYCEALDLVLVGVEVDAGLSAKNLNRPALQRALAALKQGKADALLVVRLDRLTRSVRDLGTLLDDYFAGGKYGLISVGESVDTRSAAGRLVLNLLTSVAEWERQACGERTRAALGHKASLGEYVGGRVRYGYRISDDGIHLEPVEAEQVVIRAARELAAAGLSRRGIANTLAERGMLPRNGGTWSPNTIASLIAA